VKASRAWTMSMWEKGKTTFKEFERRRGGVNSKLLKTIGRGLRAGSKGKRTLLRSRKESLLPGTRKMKKYGARVGD